MNKIAQSFIILMIITLLAVTSVSSLVAQESPSPSPTSLSNTVTNVPVMLEDKTLLQIRASLGRHTIPERAEQISQKILEFAQDQSHPLDDLSIYEGDADGIPFSSVNVANNTLVVVSNEDARLAGMTRSELTQEYFQNIKEAVSRYRQERRLDYLLGALWRCLLATLALVILLAVIQNIFAHIYQRLKLWGESYFRPIRIGNLELIRANQLDNIIQILIRLIQATIILGLLATYFPFVFKQFPWTRRLANQLEQYWGTALQTAWGGFNNYLPSLLTIIVVITATLLLLRLSRPFFQELGEGRLSLPGFYPEWAQPTYRLITFLIVALASVIIFPLLPGFQSPAFQGISVFLGLLLSLGSTSVIANLVSGSVLIYTRAFRVGDRIKIDNISGIVIETTLLVTRILTSTNVIISIPNSQISTSSIENFSFGYRELNQPFIVRVPVYLGYEVPWRQVYQALLKAALNTVGVAQDPAPFVLQGELNEVYVTYLLNVYVDVKYFQGKGLKEVEQAKSQLNERIRDCCEEVGIQIFAPSYEADPTNYGPIARRE